MEFAKVIEIIEKVAPLDCGEDWDNSGVQIDVGNDNIKKILFCLDITDEVIEEAIETSIDLIVSHHPLIFTSLKSLSQKDLTGRYLIKLARAGISVYSAHITFDNAPFGNNYYLAQLLQLENIEEIEGNIGLIGQLPKDMEFEDLISHLKIRLELPEHWIKAVGKNGTDIQKVAICTGAGGNLIYDAHRLGCQCVITGDVKLNQALDAKALGLVLIDGGHYGTEKSFSENFKRQMKEILDDMNVNDVELCVARSNTNPYSIW